MYSRKSKTSVLLRLGLFFIFCGFFACFSPFFPVYVSSANGWYEDCSDISEWTDSTGSFFDYQLRNMLFMPITNNVIVNNDSITPDNSWWDPNLDNKVNSFYKVAGIHKKLPSNWDEITISSTISFNPMNQIDNHFTFVGGMDLFVLSENLDLLLQVSVWDSFPSLHNLRQEAAYFLNEEKIKLPEASLQLSEFINKEEISITISQSAISLHSYEKNDDIIFSVDPVDIFENSTPSYVGLVMTRNSIGGSPPIQMGWHSVEVNTKEKEEGNNQILVLPLVITSLVFLAFFLIKKYQSPFTFFKALKPAITTLSIYKVNEIFLHEQLKNGFLKYNDLIASQDNLLNSNYPHLPRTNYCVIGEKTITTIHPLLQKDRNTKQNLWKIMESEEWTLLAKLDMNQIKTLLTILHALPEVLTNQDLADVYGYSRSKIHHHLNRLKELGLIMKVDSLKVSRTKGNVMVYKGLNVLYTLHHVLSYSINQYEG